MRGVTISGTFFLGADVRIDTRREALEVFYASLKVGDYSPTLVALKFLDPGDFSRRKHLSLQR
jgi:hypothetical protein